MLKTYFLSLILFLLFFFLPIRNNSRADFAGLKIEYSQKLAEYNEAYSDYQIAKGSYLTYKTLAALTQALEKSKTYLAKRDELIIKHFELLKEKSNSKIADEEITFYRNHLSSITAIATLKDIETVAKKAEDQIPTSNIHSKQILGQILISKVQEINNSYSNIINETNGLEAKIMELKKSGKNTDKLERWLIEVKNKKMLCETLLAQVNDQLNALKGNSASVEKDFNEMRIDISQANLYLKEGANYIKEILEEIKYD